MPAATESSPGPIVVGIERSERSRDALALARTLAGAVGTDLLLVGVYPVAGRSAVMPPGAYAAALAEEADSTLASAAGSLIGVAARTRPVASTSVARGLQRVAEDEGALAIVVGPSHRGPLGRVVPGSVGERLLESAPCPVAVASRGYREHPFEAIRRIGLGFVATPESDDALGAAVGLASRTGASIRALSVVEMPASVAMGAGWDLGKLELRAADRLATGLARALAAVSSRVDVSGDVINGYADDELARLSDEVDLLVCGSRARGPLGRVMLGSVSVGVMRKARCPVLVIPRGAEDGFAALPAPLAPEARHV